MMKHFRILALILALVTLLSVFAACEKKPAETTAEQTTAAESKEETTADPEKVLDVEKKNYDADYFLSNCDDVNPMRYYWADPKKTETDPMYEAVYSRQQKLQDHLGVTITVSDAGGFMEYASLFKTAVKTNSDSVHTLLTHVSSGVPSLVSEGYLQDFGQLPGIDLYADHWNSDFMDSLAISTDNGDYYYLGFSNFNILYTFVVAFNKQMMEDKAASVLPKSVYQMVTDYEWTVDQMLSLAQLVSEDPSNDGKTTDDTFGLTGQQWVPWIGLMHASGINYVERDAESGEYRIAMMNDAYKERTNTLVSKLKEFSNSKYGFFEFPKGGTIVGCQVPLTSGRTLMQLASTNDLVYFLDSDITFGVLPYPTFDTNQKYYRSLQWGGYLTIPSSISSQARTMVGESLEVLSFYSDDVMFTFYEKMLGKQAADVPDDTKMLDIIWDSVCTDFGQTYSDICGGTLYIFPSVTWPGDGGKELSSTVSGSMEKSGNKAIRKYINAIEKSIANQQ